MATMLATDPKVQLWVYRSKKPGTYTISEFGHEMIRSSIDRTTEVLTEAQGGCEWHIIRAGSGLITSTVAFTIAQLLQANALRQNTPVADQEISLLNRIGISTTEYQDANQLPAREILTKMKVAELKALCRNRGLQIQGNKQDLITRLETSPIADVNITSVLLSKWFMKPIRSSYFKIGSGNEASVLRSLNAFLLSDESQGFSLEGEPVCRGLLRRKAESDSADHASFLATSIDGVAVVSRRQIINEQEYTTTRVCILELKTMCTSDTEKAAHVRLTHARAQCNDLQRTVFSGPLQSDLFKTLIWNSQYKAQVLHHAAVSSVPNVMFVVASSSTIIYSFIVEFDLVDLETYVGMMERVCQQNISAFRDARSQLNDNQVDFGHAVDAHTIHTWQKLSSAIIQIHTPADAESPNRRLPPAHDVLPYAVSLWNHVKGGQDVCSRILKNVKVDFRGLTPRAYILIRFIMTALMNAHLLARLLRAEDELGRFTTYVSLKQFLNRQSSFWDSLRNMILGDDQWEPSCRMRNWNQQDQSSEPNEIALRRSSSGSVQASKRNVLSWLNAEGRNVRLDTSKNHIIGSRNSRTCPLCKARTTCYCQSCDVNLCRFTWGSNRKTCFEKVHTTQGILILKERPVEKGGALGRRGRKRSASEAVMEEMQPLGNRRARQSS